MDVETVQLSPAMTQRKYLPTLAELIDRLSISQLKAIFISDHTSEYTAEMALIMHDVDLLLAELPKLGADEVRSIMILMLTNRFIWENESKARAGGSEQDHLLKLTHSINGVRNMAKNKISAFTGERRDHKIDCLAEDLVQEFGNWNVFQATE